MNELCRSSNKAIDEEKYGLVDPALNGRPERLSQTLSWMGGVYSLS